MSDRGGGGNTDNVNSTVNVSGVTNRTCTFRASDRNVNPYIDPSLSNQYLYALSQLFAYNNTNNMDVFNYDSYDTSQVTDTFATTNCTNHRGHYAGCHIQASPCLNVDNSIHYGFSIDTNIYHQWNTSIADVVIHPDAGNHVFLLCKCQSPCNDGNVDTSLAVSSSVLCTLDFIQSLDVVDNYQVVFLHDPRGHNSGFYRIYHNDGHGGYLYTCLDSDLGPFQVIDRRVVKVVFCDHILHHGLNCDLTPKQAVHDHRKDLWARGNYNMSYTQHIETIIGKLCLLMDSHSSRGDLQPPDAPGDAIGITHIPNSITALLDIDTNTTLQVDHDAYIPSKTVGFLSHEDTVFEFVGPDRLPVSIDSVDRCVEIANIIRTTGLPNYRLARIPIISNLKIEAWEKELSAYSDKHLNISNSVSLYH